ncbi:hypothetical protein [Pseudoxanthomonas putridarboris]|uniref:Uncharacterized protein n=1 Tax=Pseudoxanthomonas putridarboris TaxID=752605 RepID=A0ABU9J2S6_9GAMM
MKTLPLAVLLAALPAMSAWAQSSAEALDLSLPRDAAYTADPPGTFYGDKSGRTAARAADAARETRDPCVLMHDDRDGDGITGSVTTGIGYSKGYGSSTYNAANLNLCKSYTDDDGDTRTFNFNIHVDRYDGPGGYGRPYGPMPPQGPYRP